MRSFVPIIVFLSLLVILIYGSSSNIPSTDTSTLLKQGLLTRKQQTVVFLHVVTAAVPNVTSNNTDQYWFRNVSDSLHLISPFFPYVDEFTSVMVDLHQNGTTASDTSSNSTNATTPVSNTNSSLRFEDDATVYLWLEVGGVASNYYRYFKHPTTPGAFAAQFVVIVNTDKGNITSVEWQDDLCSEIGTQNPSCVGPAEICNSGFLYSSTGTCEGSGNSTVSSQFDYNSCNMKVFVAWLGDDKSGATMTSYRYTPAQFSQYSAVSVFQAAAGVASDSFISSGSVYS